MTTETKTKKPELQKRVPMSDIEIWGNYRESTTKQQDEELDASVKTSGVVQSVLLRYTTKPEKFQLIIGGRRHASSKRNGLKDIPAIIRDLTDEEAAELQLIENIQRAGVHAMEEARGFKRLLGFKNGNVHEVAASVGKHISYVARRLKLNDVYEEFQKAFHQNRMRLTDIEQLFKISTDAQKELWGRKFKSVKGEIHLNEWDLNQLMGKLSRAPFDTKDAELDKKAGACTTCPLNTASNTMLFPDGAKDATCGNIGCFNNKSELHLMVNVKKAIEDPSTVIVSTRESYEGESDQHKALSKKGVEVIQKKSYNRVHTPDKKAIDSGKVIKALCIDGHDAGKFMYIQIAKSGPGNSSAAAVKEKLKSGKVTRTDIEAEISRIKINASRKRELVEEAIAPEIYNLIDDDEKGHNKIYFENTGSLNLFEKIAVIMAIGDKLEYDADDKFQKKIGMQDITYNERGLFDFLIKNPTKVEAIYNAALRYKIADKLKPANKGCNAEKSSRYAAMEAVITSYNAKGVKAIREKHAEGLVAYDGRVKEKLSGLNEKLKEFPVKKAEAKAATKKKSNAKKK